MNTLRTARTFRRLKSPYLKGWLVDGKNRVSDGYTFQHMLVVGPTGSGKTSCLVIPELLRAKGRSSYFVFDPSGEIQQATQNHLCRKGYHIQTVAFGEHGSHGYNPLAYVHDPKTARELAQIMIGSDQKGDPFWQQSGANILKLFFLAVSKRPADQNLGMVVALLRSLSSDRELVDEYMARTLDESSFDGYKALAGQEAKLLSHMVSTATTFLDAAADSDIMEAMLCEPAVDFEALRRRPGVVFVRVPEHDIATYRFLMAPLYVHFFRTMIESRGLPVRAFLDEFANTGHIVGFETLITTLRKRKVGLCLILQSLHQLSHIYGPDVAKIIRTNTQTKVYFSGLDTETCQMIEREAGTRADEHGREIPIIKAAAFQKMRGKALVMLQDRLPIVSKLRPFYRSRIKRRVG